MPDSRFRWRPAALILLIAAVAAIIIRSLDVWPYEQSRTLALLSLGAITIICLAIWWFFFSRVSGVIKTLSFLLLVPLTLFRYRGMSGDFVPILEFRFSKKLTTSISGHTLQGDASRPSYPQLFGPNRDGRISGPELDPDWKTHPPALVWRIPMGAAWSGFVTSGNRALTQEQDREQECVTCYELTTGKQLWKTTNPGRYDDPIAGVGPRATPSVIGNRVVTLGALGKLQCLDLETGKVIWARDMAKDAEAKLPQWGFASSPLIHEGKVIVSAGGSKSLLAYRLDDGEIAWIGGSRPANYSSPFIYTVAGKLQIIMFNSEAITAHDPATGAVLWERPWGKGLPHVSRPIPVGDRQLMFSSGYGVGSALLELKEANGKLEPDEVWKTVRFQSKFATPVERNGFVYGVSDGFFSCLDLRDGTVKWKGPRYGHGQGLLVGEYVLQMTEQPGDLVLLKPTPEAPNELGRIPVFEMKTWNPIALTGDLLLARTDQEAVCFRLPVKGKL